MRLFTGTKWDQPPVCERCGEVTDDCQCPPLPEPEPDPIPPDQQRFKVAVEKRKKGKLVTVIKGLEFAAPAHGKQFMREIKDFCGAGGKLDDEGIEIQGDHRLRVLDFLKKRGYKSA